MVKNIEELKNLIIWAKEQKIKTLKLADIHVEISDLAFIESIQNQETVVKTNVPVAETKESDDDVLFWSSRP